MKLPRRAFLHLAAGAAALSAMSRMTSAQAYPARPVRLIIGVAPGSAPDILGRLTHVQNFCHLPIFKELADEVTEASYVEALASAQSKKAGIWGDGPR